MDNPLLTIVMPVYNGEKYLKAAIDSVLGQTFRDFELIIINDGSLDSSLKIISSINDARIRLISLDKNKGIPYCRNLGLREAKGDFLGWTDCDDLNFPQRFEKQVSFLQENSDYGGCGTWLSRFRGEKTFYVNKASGDAEKIRAELIFKPAAIPNPTVMLRLSEIKKHNLNYNEELPISEDYDFIFRCSRHFKFTVIQELLYGYRDSETSIMKKFENEDLKSYEVHKIVYKKVLATLNFNPTEEEFRMHYNLCSSKIFKDFSEFNNCYEWLEKIKNANDAILEYDKKVFNKVAANQFYFLSKKASSFGLKTLYFFTRKSFKNNWFINPENFSKLAIRCALKHDKFEFRKNT